METKWKWAFAILLVGVLAFSALNTVWARSSMNDLVSRSNQQNETLASIDNSVVSQSNQMGEALASIDNNLVSQSNQMSETLENINDELSTALPLLHPKELKVKTLQAFVEAPPNADALWHDVDTWTPTTDIEIYHVYAQQPGEIDVRWQFAVLTTNPKCNVDDDIAEAFLTEGLIMAQSLSQGYTVEEIRANRHDVGNNINLGSQNFIKIPAGTTLRVHFGCGHEGDSPVYPTAWFHIYYREVASGE